MTAVRFRLWMTGVAVLAGAIQFRFIHAVASGTAGLSPDGAFAHTQAYWLIRGYWFVDPSRLDPHAAARSTSALHPPLNSLLLVAADAAGAVGVTAQRVLLALIFVAATVVAGLAVRVVAGERAAILGAAIFASFPALWVNPATLGPETLTIALTSLLLFGAARFWVKPSVAGAAEIGTYLGLAVLTRTDLMALVVLVGLPLALLVRRASWADRARYCGVMLVLAALIVAPWLARNVATFSRTTLVSDDVGSVWAGANCPATANGPLAGWWSEGCVDRVARPAGDQSVEAAALSAAGSGYASSHSASLVRVGFIRIGRIWNLYEPLGQARLEATVGRPVWVSDLSLWFFYPMVPLALLGAGALWRRRSLLFPFIAMFVLSTLTALVAYGDARYAVEGDVAMALLTGVALDSLWNHRRDLLLVILPGPSSGRHVRPRHPSYQRPEGVLDPDDGEDAS